MHIHQRRIHRTTSDVEDVNDGPILTEEDQSLVLLLFLSLVLTIFLPCILVISPNLLSDGPVLLSLVLLLITGPMFVITVKEARFLLSGILSIATCIYDTIGYAVNSLRCDILS